MVGFEPTDRHDRQLETHIGFWIGKKEHISVINNHWQGVREDTIMKQMVWMHLVRMTMGISLLYSLLQVITAKIVIDQGICPSCQIVSNTHIRNWEERKTIQTQFEYSKTILYIIFIENYLVSQLLIMHKLIGLKSTVSWGKKPSTTYVHTQNMSPQSA